MATLTVTVKQHDNTTTMQYVLVRVYDASTSTLEAERLVASGTTDSSGVVALTVPNGDYKIHATPQSDRLWDPQWLGPHGYGVMEEEDARIYSISANTGVTFLLETPQHLRGLGPDQEVDLVPWVWWVDTTNSDAILRLLPGEERRPFNGDKLDPLHKHVLLGPFLNRADAAAAAA